MLRAGGRRGRQEIERAAADRSRIEVFIRVQKRRLWPCDGHPERCGSKRYSPMLLLFLAVGVGTVLCPVGELPCPFSRLGPNCHIYPLGATRFTPTRDTFSHVISPLFNP